MSDRSQLIETGTPFQFDAERDTEFERLVKRYPTRESMILPALWMAQEQEGWISAEAIGYIADRIGTFASKVFEVATFYTMYNLLVNIISVFAGHSLATFSGNSR